MKLLITIFSLISVQYLGIPVKCNEASKIFFPVPITIQTGTSGSSSSTTGRPGDQQINTSISFNNVANITDMVIYLTQNISRAMRILQFDDEDLESASEILKEFVDTMLAAVTPVNMKTRKRRDIGDDLRDSIQKGVEQKMNTITNKVLTNLNKPKQNTSSSTSGKRRKRGFYDSFNSFTNSISETISDLIPGSNKNTSEGSSAIFAGLNSLVPNIGNNIEIPTMDSINNAIQLPGEMMAASNFFRDLANIGKQFAFNITQSISSIAQDVAAYSGNIYQSLSQDLENANETVQQMVQEEVIKSEVAFNMVNSTLNQVGQMISALKTNFQGSECVKKFTDFRGLLSEGEQCLRNKINNGTEIAKNIIENLSTAMKLPSHINDEATTCNNESDLVAKLICYMKIPLRLQEEEARLPISFAQRLFETIKFFATLRSDLFLCGLTTLTSIGGKLVGCGVEIAGILRDTI